MWAQQPPPYLGTGWRGCSSSVMTVCTQVVFPVASWSCRCSARTPGWCHGFSRSCFKVVTEVTCCSAKWLVGTDKRMVILNQTHNTFQSTKWGWNRLFIFFFPSRHWSLSSALKLKSDLCSGIAHPQWASGHLNSSCYCFITADPQRRTSLIPACVFLFSQLGMQKRFRPWSRTDRSPCVSSHRRSLVAPPGVRRKKQRKS